MATITKYLINGQPTEPFREAVDVTVNAEFGTQPQASINIDSISLVDSAGALNSTIIRDAWGTKPTEGIPFSIEISDDTVSFDFDFYTDYNKMVFLSEVETQIGLIKDKGIAQLLERAAGITQQLLHIKALLTLPDYSTVPYIVENRKTLLEKINILFQTYITFRAITNEIFKLLNIAADITTAGAIQAVVNLTTTIAAIGALVSQLINLFKQIQEAFFPPVRYHAALKPKVFIEKAVVNYMGYDSVDFGTLTDLMDGWTITGSKNDEKGFPQYILLAVASNQLNDRSGMFKPSDNGYFLIDMIDLIKKQFNCDDAVIDNVYHLRPKNDPFWVSQSGYQLPSVKVEQIFANNGTIRPNYEDVWTSTILQYATDDSDLWTLEDLSDESDPNSTGKIITVVTVDPLVVTDQRKVILKGAKEVNTPHCLAVRKDSVDDLLDLFLGASEGIEVFKKIISATLTDLALGSGNPVMADLILSFGNRTGAMKVENDYFSIPKQCMIVTNSGGLPTIPANFVDSLGTTALYNNYHSWDSFIPGKRNPNDNNQTAGKDLYEDVRIPFGLQDFSTILNNSYFTTLNGEVGKFTKVEWNVRGDFAVVNYWIYNAWLTNIEETIS